MNDLTCHSCARPIINREARQCFLCEVTLCSATQCVTHAYLPGCVSHMTLCWPCHVDDHQTEVDALSIIEEAYHESKQEVITAWRQRRKHA